MFIFRHSPTYRPTGGKDRIPKPNFRSCLVWFIILIVVIGIIVSVSVIFDIDTDERVYKFAKKAEKVFSHKQLRNI